MVKEIKEQMVKQEQLEKCSKCGKWNRDRHHEGLCNKCWEKKKNKPTKKNYKKDFSKKLVDKTHILRG